MDNLQEVLNILDIVKNGDLYEARIQEIKAEQAKITDIRYVNMTMAQADAAREEAKAEREKYQALSLDLNEQIAQIRKEAQRQIDATNEDTKKVLLANEALADKVEERSRQVEEQAKTTEARFLRLNEYEKQVTEREAKAQRQKTEYEVLVSRLRQIIG